MTKKEMFDFVDEKFKDIEKLEIAVHQKAINSFYDSVAEEKDKCVEVARESLREALLQTGHYDEVKPGDISITVHRYGLDIKKPTFVIWSENQIKEISKRLKIEKQDFKDDLLLFGTKNPAIVDKLEALRDRVRKLMQEAEEA